MNFCLEVLSEPMVQGGGAPASLTELRRQGLKFIEDEMAGICRIPHWKRSIYIKISPIICMGFISNLLLNIRCASKESTLSLNVYSKTQKAETFQFY